MNWFTGFLTSSIGQKLIMSLTGLFLILFLVIHLVGNLQLLNDDGGEAFNKYAYFMINNPLIKTISWGLYFFILVHAVQGIVLAIKNRRARGPKRYAVGTSANTSFASRSMALFGTLILFFLIVHMGDFWYQMKFTSNLPYVKYESFPHEVRDLYMKVSMTFSQLWFVIAYVVSMIVLAFHLQHGFQSAFQTLGLSHRKYSPVIRFIGSAYALLIPLGFAIIPVYFYLMLR
jgi:succinate dehydrogenase / fumarate reductase cytochrome b subunit